VGLERTREPVVNVVNDQYSGNLSGDTKEPMRPMHNQRRGLSTDRFESDTYPHRSSTHDSDKRVRVSRSGVGRFPTLATDKRESSEGRMIRQKKQSTDGGLGGGRRNGSAHKS